MVAVVDAAVVVVIVVGRIVCGNDEDGVFFSRINFSHFLLTPWKKIWLPILFYCAVLTTEFKQCLFW